jgi:hypothetical protein
LPLKQGDVDVVVASRYTQGGGTGDWGAARIQLSKFGTRLSRSLVPDTLTDPMSCDLSRFASSALGVAVHFSILTLLFQLEHAGFLQGQATATIATMTFNFALNNVLTYRDERLRGMRWLRSWPCNLSQRSNRYTMPCGLGRYHGWRGMELCGNEAADVEPSVGTHRP